jgi:hypothetical protein
MHLFWMVGDDIFIILWLVIDPFGNVAFLHGHHDHVRRRWSHVVAEASMAIPHFTVHRLRSHVVDESELWAGITQPSCDHTFENASMPMADYTELLQAHSRKNVKKVW